MQTNPTDDATEVTILRGRVAELERQLWQARHDYGQALQQNARHATTIAMMRKAQTRTAEDERRDTLALFQYHIEQLDGEQTANYLRAIGEQIAFGDHVGAADREAVKP